MTTLTNKKAKQNPVHLILCSMLTENTGRHMLDSGNHYGRNHERNAKMTLKDFQNESPVTLEIPDEVCNVNDISYTISLFHYLKDQLEVDELCREFNRRNRRAPDMDAETITGTGEKVEKWLLKNHAVKAHYCANSYNGDSNLSQVIQYTALTIDKEPYIALQIHGGCDVRGGYTYARLFKVNNDVCYEMPALESETVLVSILKADGFELRCSNTYDGCNILLDDDGIRAPELQVEMDLGYVPYTMLNDAKRNPEINPEECVITAFLSW